MAQKVTTGMRRYTDYQQMCACMLADEIERYGDRQSITEIAIFRFQFVEERTRLKIQEGLFELFSGDCEEHIVARRMLRKFFGEYDNEKRLRVTADEAELNR